MNTLAMPRLALGLVLAFFPAFLAAQTPAPVADPAAEAAFDAFFKLRDEKGAVPSAARFDALIKAGVPLLAHYPKNRRAGTAIGRLSDVAQGINDKKLLPFRDLWFSNLNLAVINARQAAEDEDTRAAFLALAAGNANAQGRLIGDKDAMEMAREKIDTLAAAPGGRRFLADQEMTYLETVRQRNPAVAEQMVRKLMEHPDKPLAGRATDELRIMEARKAPFDLKAMTPDGKAFEAAAFRGKKAVFVCFWSSDNEASLKELDALKEIYFEHRDKLEIVGVNLDTAENRAKADQVIKDKKLKWPQIIEGEGAKSATAARINVRSAPNGALLDRTGMLVLPRARAWQLVGELKKMGFKF